MTEREVSELVVMMEDFQHAERALDAMKRLHREARALDLPLLIPLLSHREAYVREAAAWPISELAGVECLEVLFLAYQRGLDEGHDNDGFTAALADLAWSEPSRVRDACRKLAASGDAPMRENALWLIEHCDAREPA